MDAPRTVIAIDVTDRVQSSQPISEAERSHLYGIADAAAAAVQLNLSDLTPTERGAGIRLWGASTALSPVRAADLVAALHTQLAGASGLRLRVALHQGPEASGDDDPLRIASVMVDAAPLQAVMRVAVRARVGVIASNRFYQALREGDVSDLDPAAFASAVLDTGLAVWLHAAGYPSPPGIPEEARAPRHRPEAPAETQTQDSAVSQSSTLGANLNGVDVSGNRNVFGGIQIVNENRP